MESPKANQVKQQTPISFSLHQLHFYLKLMCKYNKVENVSARTINKDVIWIAGRRSWIIIICLARLILNRRNNLTISQGQQLNIININMKIIIVYLAFAVDERWNK